MRWLLENWQTVLELARAHTVFAVVPTALGLLISLPIGILFRDRPGVRRAVVVLGSIVFTIPSLALFVIIPAIIGTGLVDSINVVVALTLYSTALTTRTVFEALDAVPRATGEAATAMGYGPVRKMLEVDLPLAIPVLTAGMRVVAVSNVSLVSVGALIGSGGLGTLFTSGYNRDYPDQIIAGIVSILCLALVIDRLIAFLGYLLTPWLRTALGGSRRRVRTTSVRPIPTSGLEPNNV